MKMVIRICAGMMACAIAGAATHARADELPSRKSGLWEITMDMGQPNMPPQSTRFCIDPATDAALYKLGMNAAQGMCSRTDIHRNGPVATVDTVCRFGESTMTSHAVITFSADVAFRNDIKTHFDPPMMGRSDSGMTQDGKWIGPCPADMQPGDMVMPNGMKMNLKALQGQ